MNRYCQVPNKLADSEMVSVAFSFSFVLYHGILHFPFELVVGATPIQSQIVSVSTILVSFFCEMIKWNRKQRRMVNVEAHFDTNGTIYQKLHIYFFYFKNRKNQVKSEQYIIYSLNIDF